MHLDDALIRNALLQPQQRSVALDALRAFLAQGGCPAIPADAGDGQRCDLLVASAGCGWDDAVMVLLGAGADVHIEGDAALRAAADHGHLYVVERLLAAGGDVHARGDAALLAAATRGYGPMIECLLAAGADIHAQHDAPLRRAAWRGHSFAVRLLLASGADIVQALRGAHSANRTTLLVVFDEAALSIPAQHRYAVLRAGRGNMPLLASLVRDEQRGGAVAPRATGPLLATAVADELCRALDDPSLRGKALVTLMHFLEYHGDPHARVVRGESHALLTVSAGAGWDDAVRALLAFGADVHVDDDSALRWAACWGHLAVVERLLAAGADVHAKDDEALCCSTCLPVIECLLVAGADPHAGGGRVLQRAVLANPFASDHDLLSSADRLLAAGAEVSTDRDQLLRWLARYYNFTPMVERLLIAGADVHAGHDEALRYALVCNRFALFRLLLEHGADAVAAWRYADTRQKATVAARLDAWVDSLSPEQCRDLARLAPLSRFLGIRAWLLAEQRRRCGAGAPSKIHRQEAPQRQSHKMLILRADGQIRRAC